MLLISCSNNTDNGSSRAADTVRAINNRPDEAESTAELTLLDERAAVSDDLPETDFGGANFRISVNDSFDPDMYSAEINGDILNDSIYERNSRIEERFNVVISTVLTSGRYNDPYIIKTVLAGEDAFDLTAVYTYLAGNPIMQNCYLNWNDIPYMDFSKPWWVQSANSAFSIGDKMYVSVGDLSIKTLLLTYCIYFNINQAENYNITNLYDDVYNNKWTIDYFLGLTKDVYQDVNGDGSFDEGDFFGFAGEKVTNLDVYTAAFDIPLIAKDSQNYPVLNINLDKMTQAIEKVYALYYNSAGAFTDNVGQEIYVFKNGNALFLTSWVGNAFDVFRDMDDDYGILPYPKFDDQQAEYLTNSMDNYSPFGVPITASNLDLVGIITTAMNAESYKTVMPAYYEVALQTKYTRDNDSVAMLDILMNGRNYDFSILHGSYLARLPYLFRDVIGAKSTDFMSKYSAAENQINVGLQQIIEVYEDART
jgi:hypothetical protein